MSDTVKTPRQSPFQIKLDAEMIGLTNRSFASLLGMFAHLEGLALFGDSTPAKPFSTLPKFQFLAPEKTSGFTYREFGRQIIGTTRSQVRRLQARTQEIQSLVLINNWTVAERLWAELQENCKTPLFGLSLLEELWGVLPDRVEVDGWSLTRHWQNFVLIQAEMAVLLVSRPGLIKLSDVLENQLGLWLKLFGELLDKLDEESAA